MNDIEQLVRATLTDRAGAVGAPVDLVRRARTRAHRGRRRAQAVGVAVAAAAVLLAVPGAARLWTPADSGSTVDVAAAPATEPAVPTFPFRPTVSPPGYGEPIAELSAGVPTIRYDGGPERWLTVSVSAERPAPPRWDVEPKSYSVAVGDRKASLELGRTGWVLTWQEAGGRWLRVEADGSLDREALVGYATGLTPGAVPVRWPFTFDIVPDGLVPDVVSRATVSFRPRGAPAGHGFAGKLTVMLSHTAEVSPEGRPVAVSGRAGRLLAQPGASVLSVDLGDGRTLVIQSETGLGEDELVAFGAGTQPTPDAMVAHG